MSQIDILGPSLPESVANAEFKEWLVEANQVVEVNTVIAIVESDKVAFEISAPQDGMVTEFLVKGGDTITSGQLIAKFTAQALPASAKKVDPRSSKALSDAEADAAAAQQREEMNKAQEASQGRASASAYASSATPASREDQAHGYGQGATSVVNESDYSLAAKKTNLGPKARRLIMQHGLASDEVEGYLKQKLPPRLIAGQIKLRKLTDEIAPTKTRVPMTNIRKHIAKRLLDSKNSTAMLTTFNEVDLGRIVELRKTYGEAFQKKHGIRLGFMSFFVKAVAEAMKTFPIISACIEGDDIIYSNTTDISIAVSTERGLVTPVLRSTELKSLADIEREIAEFAKKANANKLTIDDMTGGNFTITNGGVFGSLFSTPIINPPQSAILGMHGIKKRPVVVNDEIVIRPMMYLALSYDHRLIDGKDSVCFLAKVKALLEDPTSILLDL